MSQNGTSTQVYIRLGPNQQGAQASMYVSPDSLTKTWQLKLIEGRDFLPEEIAEIDDREKYEFPQAVIVTKSLAKRLWPDAASVVGKPIYFSRTDASLSARIIGVAERLQSTNAQLGEDAEFSTISPIRLTGYPETRYAVRSEPGEIGRVMKDAEDVLRKSSANPIIVALKRTTEDRAQRYRADIAMSWTLIAVSALLLLVTVSGIVGMASLWVVQRRKQIGVRRALGARKVDILRYFLLENLLITGAGVVAGLVLAIGLSQMLVYKLELPRLPGVFMWAGAGLLLLLGLASAFGPAWRATRVSPAEATRSV
jgi:putative ABC transport system permease protein